MSNDYDRYLTEHFRAIAAPSTLRWNAIAAVEHHGRYFPADKGAAILEIGPGFGNLLAHLHSCGYQNLSAVDVSLEVVETCNEVLPGSTTLAEDTGEFLSQRPEKFDLVLMLHVLEHVPRDQIIPLLQAVRGSLKTGGKLVTEVPNPAHPITGAYNRYHDFTHTMGFTDQSLAFVLRNAGFRDVTVYGCRMPRKNLPRFIQRTAQDAIELVAALGLRVFLPRQYVNLATALGGCGTK
jgi:2-polyprenyl-3-methyl-5-hydroxy-6-metoxy-1,4-benzoquinol methylase